MTTPSNAIGSFVIGVSAIGDTPLFDWTQTILSQYANSPRLAGVCELVAGYFDQSRNLDDFYDLIWNLDSAQGCGLDIWGRIVGVSRTLNVNLTGNLFGFKEANDSTERPFNESPFYSGVSVTSNYVLGDQQFRQLIITKAFANICDGSILSLNSLLRTLFPLRGDIYVTSGYDMTMTITSLFPLTAVEQAMLITSGVFPSPAGVSLSLISP